MLTREQYDVYTSDTVTWHLMIKMGACSGIIETRPFTSNEAMVQSNQDQFISCHLQLCVLCPFSS